MVDKNPSEMLKLLRDDLAQEVLLYKSLILILDFAELPEDELKDRIAFINEKIALINAEFRN